ncbi:acetyltransferase [Alteromonas gilva]|uniref:Acetyltransferase n=1 Tax=Alteromonas gilva TaxID=2987522 RepID=A0ABT5L0D4_9ALTE|nr:acetyltransferase [Alteromonas gilva]MDC8830475.1 acetyltransferase [Alteromonas gilva]
MENIIIIGAGGHAKVIIDIVEQIQTLNISGIIAPHLQKGTIFMGYPALGRDADLPQLVTKHQISGAIVAIGDNTSRQKVAETARQLCPNLKFVTAVHPTATLAADVIIGEGTVVMAGSVVNPGVQVGSFCIINTLSSVDHECKLADYASLGPRATLGGNCTVGASSMIGLGAILCHGVSVGTHTVIGAGSLVNKDVGSSVIAYGQPARVIRSRQPDERYL